MTKPATSSHRKKVDPWVGPWLRDQRVKAGKRDLTEISARLGRSKSAVSRIETGKAVVSADELPTMLAAYDVTTAAYIAASRRSSRAA